MSTPRNIGPLSILIFEECGAFVAQCLDFDIASQGKTPQEAANRLAISMAHQVIHDHTNHREPLEGFKPAPGRYWKAFKLNQKRHAPAVRSDQVPEQLRTVVERAFEGAELAMA
jgi:hypothetical protein